MAKVPTPLNDKLIKSLKKDKKNYTKSDGQGLQLLVKTDGTKLWEFRYTSPITKKRRKTSFGSYPNVKLREARDKRDEWKKQINNDIDPLQKKQQAKEQQLVKTNKETNTFKLIANNYLNKRNELNEAYKIRLERAFKNDVFPFIGTLPITEVTAMHIIDIVKLVEKRGAIESAHRLFAQISKVFKYAVSHQLAERNPCNDMEKSELLKANTKKHYPTITKPQEIKKLLQLIDEYNGDYTTRMALSLAPYVFVRPFNLRHAEWSEIDFNKKIWIIPAEKMKTKKEHIIPLTDTTLKIFQEMHRYSHDAKYIFHSLRSKTSPMSDNTLNNALRRIGYSKDELVVHGFRAMFSTIAHEAEQRHEVIETQLAHSIGSNVSQAYNRAKYLTERKELMQWWSDYLDEVKHA